MNNSMVFEIFTNWLDFHHGFYTPNVHYRNWSFKLCQNCHSSSISFFVWIDWINWFISCRIFFVLTNFLSSFCVETTTTLCFSLSSTNNAVRFFHEQILWWQHFLYKWTTYSVLPNLRFIIIIEFDFLS